MKTNLIDSNFGVKNGRNFIHVMCYKNEADMILEQNCIAGDSRHIGVDYMKADQLLILTQEADVYDNEGGGLTACLKVVMEKRAFNKKFNDMCKRITNGESVMF